MSKIRAEIDAEVEKLVAEARAVNSEALLGEIREIIQALPDNRVRQKFLDLARGLFDHYVKVMKEEAVARAEILRDIVYLPSVEQALARLDELRDHDPEFWRPERYDLFVADIKTHYRGGSLN